MSPESKFIRDEIPEVQRLVRDECWLDGDRRGHPVNPRDRVVQERVADIILGGVGAEMRRKCGRAKR